MGLGDTIDGAACICGQPTGGPVDLLRHISPQVIVRLCELLCHRLVLISKLGVELIVHIITCTINLLVHLTSEGVAEIAHGLLDLVLKACHGLPHLQ